MPEFLASDEGRPLRILILSEYLEPLKRFEEKQIEDTVVFFGSARVDSQRRATQAHKREQARSPKRAERLRRCRQAVAWSRHYEEARELRPAADRLEPGLGQAAAIDSSSAPVAGPASWRRPIAARTRPAARRSG